MRILNKRLILLITLQAQRLKKILRRSTSKLRLLCFPFAL